MYKENYTHIGVSKPFRREGDGELMIRILSGALPHKMSRGLPRSIRNDYSLVIFIQIDPAKENHESHFWTTNDMVIDWYFWVFPKGTHIRWGDRDFVTNFFMNTIRFYGKTRFEFSQEGIDHLPFPGTTNYYKVV